MTSDTADTAKNSQRWQPRSLYYWLARLGASTSGTIFTLVLLNIFCYSATVDGYFLADDFSHVSYLYSVFNGHPELLLENFWTNWTQTEGTQFYRPIISLTLAFDYLFWSGNAKGFHLSNLVFQILSSIGVFLVSKRLFLTDLRGRVPDSESAELEKAQPTLYRLSPDHAYTISFTALLAASIFAVHPLHPEVVSWIIGRVDSVCTSFYLFSLWLFLVSIQSTKKKTIKRAKIASLTLFAIALGSKEMAVTLPPTLVLLLLFFQTPVYGRAKSLPVRILNGIKASWHYWVLLLGYLVIRTLALGTFLGGYQGSIGEGLTTTIVERLMSQRSVLRVMFPLNLEIFSPDSKWFFNLRIIYGVTLSSFVLSLLISRSKHTVIKSVLFTGFWFLLIMIPTIPVWNLTDSLQSSRFIYMGTVPLSILLAIIICPLARHGRRKLTNREKSNFTLRVTQDALKGISATVAIVLVISFAIITNKNNSCWARAGTEVKKLRAALESTLKSKPESKKIALLNTPDRYKGAHMIYNGAQLQVLLEPPLTPHNWQKRVLSFEPAMYGENDLVRVSRIRRLVEKTGKNQLEFYAWDRNSLKLELLRFNLRREEVSFKEQQTDLTSNSWLVTPYLNANALLTDFVEINLKLTSPLDNSAKDKKIPIIIYWKSTDKPEFNSYQFIGASVENHTDSQTVSVPVSQHKKWLKDCRIDKVAVSCPEPGVRLNIANLRCISGKTKVPDLQLSNAGDIDERGITNLGPEIKNLRLSYDATTVSGAHSAILEISKPNSWFEHYSGTFRDTTPSSQSLAQVKLENLSSKDYSLDLKDVTQSGFYQVRLIAIDQSSNPVGYTSDPLVLQVSR